MRLCVSGISLALCLALVVAAARAEALSDPYEASMIVMGTIGRAQVWGLPERKAAEIADKIFRIWKRVDQTMSLYKPFSDLVRLNNAAGKEPVTVCPELLEILSLAKDYHNKTHGLFDVRVGALMDVWGLGVVPRESLPAPKEVFLARRSALRGRILLFPKKNQGWIRDAAVKIDLGGIAKGFALDKACEVLRSQGVPHAILDLGGQLMIYRPPSGGWRIGVREPGCPQEILGTIHVQNTCSIAASSQEDRFIRRGKRRIGHVLDPRTGFPVLRRGAVTVIAPSATEADVLGKLFFIMNPDQTNAQMKDFQHVQVLRVSPAEHAGSWKVWLSAGLQGLFEPQIGKEARAAGSD